MRFECNYIILLKLRANSGWRADNARVHGYVVNILTCARVKIEKYRKTRSPTNGIFLIFFTFSTVTSCISFHSVSRHCQRNQSICFVLKALGMT